MKKRSGFINWIVLGLLLVFPMIAFAQTSGTSNERITGEWRFEQKTDFNMAQPSDTKTAIQVTGGSVRIGTGTPGTTPGRNDLYVGGTLEVDGVPRFDATTISLRGITYTIPAADGGAGTQLTTSGAGVLSWAAAGGTSTAWDDIGNPDAHGSVDFTTFNNVLTGAATATNQHQFINTGNMGDVAIVYIEQMTGTPTDGKLLYLTAASDLVDGIHIYNTSAAIAATGNVLLRLDYKANDDADGFYIVGRDNTFTNIEFSVDMLGAIVGHSIAVSGTNLDINSLDFVGAGEIKTAAASSLTLSVDDGATAGEDLIITANNISLTAVGLMTFSPDAALAIAIDASAANIATALNVGANDIVGTTGLINYTNFDVNADGDVVCVDLTASGAVNVGTFKQDALVPASGSPHTITMNAGTTGEILIGGVSTGAIRLGGGGGATLVDLPLTVDMTLTGGTLGITNTAAGPTLSITNNTLTATNLVTLSATAITTGNLVSATGGGVVAGSIYYAQATEGATFTGFYFRGYDGTANDITIARHGATVITGSAAGTDALTLTNGDILVSAGNIDITTGTFTVGTGSVAIATNGNFSSARGGIQLDTVDDDGSYIKRNQAITTTVLFELEETNVLADTVTFVVDSKQTGAFDSVDIEYAGTTNALHITNSAATGEAIYIDVGNATTAKIITIDAGPWLGTAGQGIIDIRTDSAATAEAGHGIYIKFQGTAADAAAIDGKGLYIEDEGAVQAGSYLVKLDSLANGALHISNAGAAADGIKFDVANAYTGQGIIVDAGPWLGTAGEGFINFESDNAATAEAGQVIRINLRGTAADAAAISGKGIYIKDTAAATVGSYLAHFESTSNGAAFFSGPVSLQAAAPLVGASPIVLEGVTADGSEITLAVMDPTSDTTITIPDAPASSDLGVTLATGGTTTTQAAAGTSTVTGSSIAVPAAHAGVGQVYKWEFAGNKAGANAAMQVHLKLDATQVMSLSGSDAAAGDYIARFTLWIVDNANQKIFGELLVNGKVVVTDYATGAVNIAGAVNFITQITSANAGDTVTAEMVNVYYTE